MVDSVLRTSSAHVLLYKDNNDDSDYSTLQHYDPRVRLETSHHIGRNAAINYLCALPDAVYDRYVIACDDIVFMHPWEQGLNNAMLSFGDEIGVVMLGEWTPTCCLPCVSRRWIDTLGHLVSPHFYAFLQDTTLTILGEALGRIIHINDPPVIEHRSETFPDKDMQVCQDAMQLLKWTAQVFPGELAKLRAAMSVPQ